jgi:soluble lytic murein transglycosylase-like protein
MIKRGRSRRTDRIMMCQLCGLALGLLAPTVMRAQSPETGVAALDTWRGSLTQRLDEDIVKLNSDARNEPAAATSTAKVSASQETVPESPRPPSLSVRASRLRFPAIEGILAAEGLPVALTGIAAAESNFNPAALSPKGARGFWQLMPATARRYGLAVDDRHDERLDPLKSTMVAARYLHDLYAQFQDWLLVLAAYNAGEGRVQNAVERVGTHNFWTLSHRQALPEETRRYVPTVLERSGRRLGRLAGMYSAESAAKFRPGLVMSIGSEPQLTHVVYALNSAIPVSGAVDLAPAR